MLTVDGVSNRQSGFSRDSGLLGGVIPTGEASG